MSDLLTYFAKVENNIVTDVHVVAYDFIVANPDRYGDPSLWIETFYDIEGVTYAGIGYTYDAATNTFSPPPPADLDEFVTPEITEIVTEEESVTPDGNN